MMAVVTERRREIGLKKALGASNQSVVTDFLGEGIMLGAFGGLLGAGFGYLFALRVSLSVFSREVSFLLPLQMCIRDRPEAVLRSWSFSGGYMNAELRCLL